MGKKSIMNGNSINKKSYIIWHKNNKNKEKVKNIDLK